MRIKRYGWKALLLTAMMVLWLCGLTALAEGASGDNSLSSLGIITEGVTVSPEFYYSTIEYNLTVPAGTTTLELNPVTSNENATIVDISGTELTNGEGTVTITVAAENGNQYSYYLYVTTDESTQAAAAPVAETEPETETETETEEETEDPRYVRVDRDSLVEAENTITTLKTEASTYRDRLNLLTKILYGLIGLCVILLFVVINLILKKKDLKAELQEYMSLGYSGEEGGSAGNMAAGRGEKKGAVNYDGSYAGEDQWYDDPASVPKPSRAKKKAKPMPEYQPPAPEPEYQPPKDGATENVEINMIDL